MRVRNTHPNRPLMCSGLHLQPGVWHTVDEGFRVAHSGVADLEFALSEQDVPSLDVPSLYLNRSPAEVSAISGERLARLHAESDEAALERAGYEPDPEPANGQAAPLDPYGQGRAAALTGRPEDSSPFPDGRTKDAKEWRRGWREAFLAQ